MVNGASFSDSGLLVLTSSEDHTARIWDALNGKQLTVLRGHTRTVTRAVFGQG